MKPTTESLEAIQAICRAHNRAGVSMIRRDEEEQGPERDEDAGELSDLEYHGQFESFTHRG